MTVLNNDGLVGRVLRVTSTTATVLLIVDTDSVVGGRVGESMEVGFLHGRGEVGDSGRLDLELVDECRGAGQGRHGRHLGQRGRRAVRRRGARSAASPASTAASGRRTQRAVIDPYVDFGSLDLVGVVVPSGTHSDRAVIEADGSLK